MYVELLPFCVLAKKRRLGKQELHSFIKEFQNILDAEIKIKDDKIVVVYSIGETVEVLVFRPVDKDTVEVKPTSFLTELEETVKKVPFEAFIDYLSLITNLSGVFLSPAGQDYLMRIGSDSPKILENLEITLMGVVRAVRESRRKLQRLNNQSFILKPKSRKNEDNSQN